jgi:hypothetical protein
VGEIGGPEVLNEDAEAVIEWIGELLPDAKVIWTLYTDEKMGGGWMERRWAVGYRNRKQQRRG